jgi:transcriptional regulator with GAF, ATPase, and Fis domain
LDKAGASSRISSVIQSPAKTGKGCSAIVGDSRPMQRVFSLINKVCDAETTVLVRGESGTGKELIAQALHYEGIRGSGPFVPVNCGAIPGELLESELFGHEKGAFTHAIRTRLGRFELADGGTVFLDEISEMSPMLQVKLLRVLQEKEFERIGGTKTITSDFRVVAATNRNLEQEVRAGRFREDLYYRLNVIPIEAPPLRERVQDIPLLVEHFVARFNRLRKKKINGVAEDVMTRFAGYAWPGNVRELENMLERMVILASGDSLSAVDLPERLLEDGAAPVEPVEELPGQGFFLNEVLADFEKRLILQALEQTDWVKIRAARLLNVNRTTLIEKMKRFKLVSSAAEV